MSVLEMQEEASVLMASLSEDTLAKWLAVGRAMKREANATTPEEAKRWRRVARSMHEDFNLLRRLAQ